MAVGDQGAVGSCVAWAIAYNQMGWYSNKAGAQVAFSPMYVYSQVHTTNDPEGGGTSPAAVYGITSTQGVDTQDDYNQGNYDFTDLPTAAEIANAAAHKSLPATDLYSGAPGPSADAVIEAALDNQQPVALMIPDYSAFDNLNSSVDHLDAANVDPTTFRGYHEVLAVGYDASGVRIENQWGTGWGDAGYGWLDWNFVEQYSVEASVIDGLVEPTPPPPAVSQPAVPGDIAAVLGGAGPGSATLTWTAPADTGGSPITGYRVQRDGTDGGWSQVVNAGTQSQTFTQLRAGTTYTLSVDAINASGDGVVGSATISIPVGPKASRPQDLSVSTNGRVRAATISWAAPATDGGYPVIGYVVARDGHDSHGGGPWSTTVGPTSRAFRFTLLLATRYRYTVAAVTSQGVGAAAHIWAVEPRK